MWDVFHGANTSRSGLSLTQHLNDAVSREICALLGENPDEVYSLTLRLQAGLEPDLEMRKFKQAPSGDVYITYGKYEIKQVERAV